MNNYMNTDYTRDELITLALKMAIRQVRKWQDNAINECDIDAAEHYENLANAYRAIIEENHAQQDAPPPRRSSSPPRPRTRPRRPRRPPRTPTKRRRPRP